MSASNPEFDPFIPPLPTDVEGDDDAVEAGLIELHTLGEEIEVHSCLVNPRCPETA